MPKTTTKPMVRIHNTDTNEVIDREMTNAELAQYEADKAANKAAEAAKEKAEADKAAILERLGLTADELKTILG
jgi:hypothetical protein